MAARHGGWHLLYARTSRAFLCSRDSRCSSVPAWTYTAGKWHTELRSEGWTSSLKREMLWNSVCSPIQVSRPTAHKLLLAMPHKCSMQRYNVCGMSVSVLHEEYYQEQCYQFAVTAVKHLGPGCGLLSHTDEEPLEQAALLECDSLNKWIIYQRCLLKLKSFSQFSCYFHHLHILSLWWWEPIWLTDRVLGKMWSLSGPEQK